MNETSDLASLSRSRTECPLLGPWFEPCGLWAQQHHAMDQTRHLASYIVSYIEGPRQLAVPVLMFPPLRGLLSLRYKPKAHSEGAQVGLQSKARDTLMENPEQWLSYIGNCFSMGIFSLGIFFLHV